MSWGLGNAKLNGKGRSGLIATWSTLPVATCPGRSKWCAGADPITGEDDGKQRCYALRLTKMRPSVRENYERNTGEKPTGYPPASVIRIHESGDFDTVDTVNYWVEYARKNPRTLFFAYTRSWRVPEIRDALEELRGIENVQLFASTDPTVEELPPAGWRVAFIKGDERFSGYQCPEQDGRKRSCWDCSYCFRGRSKNVRFKVH